MDLPDNGHNNRDVLFEPGGKKMLVTVPSFSNADDADGPLEKNRAKIFECNPDGSDVKIFAYGIRNPSFMAIDPKTNNLWITVNERDGLGDNLVPDYITHVQRGGFYGWPWWYMGGHQDPRLAGKHPELKDKVITPDVLLQPHNASVGLAPTIGVKREHFDAGKSTQARASVYRKSVFLEVLRTFQAGHIQPVRAKQISASVH
jgi:glucose/arabinose dehydrogenase